MLKFFWFLFLVKVIFKRYFPFRNLPNDAVETLALDGNQLRMSWPSLTKMLTDKLQGEDDKEKLKKLIERGKRSNMHHDSAICILTIRRFCKSDLSVVPKQVVQMIAAYLL